MGLIGCPETLVTSYQQMLHNISKELRPDLVKFWYFISDVSTKVIQSALTVDAFVTRPVNSVY